MLLSERIKVNPYFNWCLSFWYHMYGNSVGSLIIMAKKNPRSNNGGYLVKIWQTSGNQGDQWHWKQLQVNSGVDFQVCVKVKLRYFNKMVKI